eukprot:226165-Amphidinium_carterae.1
MSWAETQMAAIPDEPASDENRRRKVRSQQLLLTLLLQVQVSAFSDAMVTLMNTPGFNGPGVW